MAQTNKISIDKLEMERSAKLFGESAASAGDLLRNLTTEVNGMQDKWAGAAHNAFVQARQSTYSKSLSNLANQLKSVSGNLTTTARDMDQADRAAASRMK